MARRLALSLVFALGCAVRAGAGIPAAHLPGFAFDQHVGGRLPLAAPLTDETATPVVLGRYFGTVPAILVLQYHRCPNLCGLVLADLVQALTDSKLQPGRDYQLVAVSIDPTETPGAAMESKRAHEAGFPWPGADAGWHFLVGTKPSIREIATAVGYPFQYDPTIGQYAHPTGIVVTTPDGRISRYLLGLGYSGADLARAITDAASARIAAPAPPLLLLCYHFDPKTGRYDFAIDRMLQAGGALITLALGVLVWRGLRRSG